MLAFFTPDVDDGKKKNPNTKWLKYNYVQSYLVLGVCHSILPHRDGIAASHPSLINRNRFVFAGALRTSSGLQLHFCQDRKTKTTYRW